MSILVTGSAGHLGEALMRTFGESAEPARGIDILEIPLDPSHLWELGR